MKERYKFLGMALCVLAIGACLLASGMPAISSERDDSAVLTAGIFGRLGGAVGNGLGNGLSRVRERGRQLLGVERRQERRHDRREERRLSRAGFGC